MVVDNFDVLSIAVSFLVLGFLFFLTTKFSRIEDKVSNVEHKLNSQEEAPIVDLATNLAKMQTTVTERLDAQEKSLGKSLDDVSKEAMKIAEGAASIESIFQQKGDRANWSEISIFDMVKDSWPKPENVFLRKRYASLGGLTPDVSIKMSVQGGEGNLICIDAKFPLENFRHFNEASDDKTRESYAKKFKGDVERHIEKVSDYVKPEVTFRVAFLYIPSERIYNYIIDNESTLVKEAVKSHNVVITSPLTILANLHFLVHAERLLIISDNSRKTMNKIEEQRTILESVDSEYQTLLGHLNNARNKAGEVREKLGELRIKNDEIDKSISSSGESSKGQ